MWLAETILQQLINPTAGKQESLAVQIERENRLTGRCIWLAEPILHQLITPSAGEASRAQHVGLRLVVRTVGMRTG
jgi:hypothetical protein